MCGIMHEWIDGGGLPNPKWGHRIPERKDSPGHCILGSSDRGSLDPRIQRPRCHRQRGLPNPPTPVCTHYGPPGQFSLPPPDPRNTRTVRPIQGIGSGEEADSIHL